MENIQINVSHIGTIKKDSNNFLFVDYIPCDNEFKTEIKYLAKQVEDKDVSLFDMYSTLENSKLWEKINRSFDYCKDLAGTYSHGIPTIHIMTNTEYKEWLEKKKSIFKYLKFHHQVDTWDSYIEKQSNIEKQKLYETIKSCVTAYEVGKICRKCKDNSDILAYSVCKNGWQDYQFSLNTDLEILIKSNFGYGRSSYFYEILKYKGIKILPYSDWVIYHFVNKVQILRYTRSYPLRNASWKTAFEFTTEIFNDMKTYPSLFVNKWIVSEIEKMTIGLRAIVVGEITVVNTCSGDKVKLEDPDEIIRFQAEKISGALSFIESIKALKELDVDVMRYVNVILNCCRDIIPNLPTKISEKQKEIEEYKKQIKYLNNNYNHSDYNAAIRWKVSDDFKTLSERFASLYGISMYYAIQIIQMKRLRQIAYNSIRFTENGIKDDCGQYTLLMSGLKKNREMEDKIIELSRILSQKEQYINELKNYRDVITTYFAENDLSLQKSA